MLSEQSAATVRATLPAVGAALGTITERFYAGLFAAHPELLNDLFNRRNQAAGTQRQALAGSIAAFATHLLDPPEQRPDAMPHRIAHKHASLGVTPEQYDVVHEHLFAAIAEVLGDAVTPEGAAAWDEVCWLMANALIAVEKRLRDERGEHAWRAWEVVERVAETDDVATFRLRPADDGPVRDFLAGQYVSVRVALPDGARQTRQYSLSGAPAPDLRQISVKRVRGEGSPDGEVSNHLHARVEVGDVLELSEPYGDLVLLTRHPRTARRSRGLRRQAARGGRPLLVRTRRPGGRPLRPRRPRRRPGRAGTRAYLCGPLPFMRAVRAQLIGKGVAPADIHYEVFGPDLWLAGHTL